MQQIYEIFSNMNPFKSLIKYFLQRMLGNYLKGDINLNNLINKEISSIQLDHDKINEEFLEFTPFSLYSADLGGLKISIPFLALLSENIEISIGDICLNFFIKDSTPKRDESVCKKSMESQKEIVNDNIEKHIDVFKNILEKILMNMKINISNINLRFFINKPTIAIDTQYNPNVLICIRNISLKKDANNNSSFVQSMNQSQHQVSFLYNFNESLSLNITGISFHILNSMHVVDSEYGNSEENSKITKSVYISEDKVSTIFHGSEEKSIAAIKVNFKIDDERIYSCLATSKFYFMLDPFQIKKLLYFVKAVNCSINKGSLEFKKAKVNQNLTNIAVDMNKSGSYFSSFFEDFVKSEVNQQEFTKEMSTVNEIIQNSSKIDGNEPNLEDSVVLDKKLNRSISMNFKISEIGIALLHSFDFDQLEFSRKWIFDEEGRNFHLPCNYFYFSLKRFEGKFKKFDSFSLDLNFANFFGKYMMPDLKGQNDNFIPELSLNKNPSNSELYISCLEISKSRITDANQTQYLDFTLNKFDSKTYSSSFETFPIIDFNIDKSSKKKCYPFQMKMTNEKGGKSSKDSKIFSCVHVIKVDINIKIEYLEIIYQILHPAIDYAESFFLMTNKNEEAPIEEIPSIKKECSEETMNINKKKQESLKITKIMISEINFKFDFSDINSNNLIISSNLTNPTIIMEKSISFSFDQIDCQIEKDLKKYDILKIGDILSNSLCKIEIQTNNSSICELIKSEYKSFHDELNKESNLIKYSDPNANFQESILNDNENFEYSIQNSISLIKLQINSIKLNLSEKKINLLLKALFTLSELKSKISKEETKYNEICLDAQLKINRYLGIEPSLNKEKGNSKAFNLSIEKFQVTIVSKSKDFIIDLSDIQKPKKTKKKSYTNLLLVNNSNVAFNDKGNLSLSIGEIGFIDKGAKNVIIGKPNPLGKKFLSKNLTGFYKKSFLAEYTPEEIILYNGNILINDSSISEESVVNIFMKKTGKMLKMKAYLQNLILKPIVSSDFYERMGRLLTSINKKLEGLEFGKIEEDEEKLNVEIDFCVRNFTIDLFPFYQQDNLSNSSNLHLIDENYYYDDSRTLINFDFLEFKKDSKQFCCKIKEFSVFYFHSKEKSLFLNSPILVNDREYFKKLGFINIAQICEMEISQDFLMVDFVFLAFASDVPQNLMLHINRIKESLILKIEHQDINLNNDIETPRKDSEFIKKRNHFTIENHSDLIINETFISENANIKDEDSFEMLDEESKIEENLLEKPLKISKSLEKTMKFSISSFIVQIHEGKDFDFEENAEENHENFSSFLQSFFYKRYCENSKAFSIEKEYIGDEKREKGNYSAIHNFFHKNSFRDFKKFIKTELCEINFFHFFSNSKEQQISSKNLASQFLLKVQEISISDYLDSNMKKNILVHQKEDDCFVDSIFELWKSDGRSGELKVYIKVSPLRVFTDSKNTDFMISVLNENFKKDEKNLKSPSNKFSSEKTISRHSSFTINNEEEGKVFVSYFFMDEFDILIDYDAAFLNVLKAKGEIAQLRNIGSFEDVRLYFPRICTSGDTLPEVFSQISQEIVNNLVDNHKSELFFSLPYLKTISTVASSILDLVRIPASEYSQGESVYKSMKKGLRNFMQTNSIEGLKFAGSLMQFLNTPRFLQGINKSLIEKVSTEEKIKREMKLNK